MSTIGWLGSRIEQQTGLKDLSKSISVLQPFKNNEKTVQHLMEENDHAQSIWRVPSDNAAALDRAEEFQTPDIWLKPKSYNFEQCIDPSKSYKKLGPASNGFILVHANGGLNQMRTGVESTEMAVKEVPNKQIIFKDFITGQPKESDMVLKSSTLILELKDNGSSDG